ncbi:MAG: F0F1 ATP synthase subunit delta [Actinomycetales bacterium]|nr:MAG: F0F1 ATP synthase subunit delta [Actinomycetales bacterium]
MTAIDTTKLAKLDAVCDREPAAESVAQELFAVVDLLDSSAQLRRAFTDPAKESKARQELASRIFSTKISASALHKVEQVVALRWSSGRVLVGALERQGVRIVLKAAQTAGSLDVVIDEIYAFLKVVKADNGLRNALAATSADFPARSELVNSLVGNKVSSSALMLLRRAAAGRKRTYLLALDSYLELAAQLRSRQIAHVVVAKPLAPEQQKRLRDALVKQTGTAIDLQIEINPKVIGGIRVQIGDDRIESTVAGRLEEAQRQLIS